MSSLRAAFDRAGLVKRNKDLRARLIAEGKITPEGQGSPPPAQNRRQRRRGTPILGARR